MRKKRHKPEEIVAKLRQVDVLTAQGKSVGGRRRPHLFRSQPQRYKVFIPARACREANHQLTLPRTRPGELAANKATGKAPVVVCDGCARALR